MTSANNKQPDAPSITTDRQTSTIAQLLVNNLLQHKPNSHQETRTSTMKVINKSCNQFHTKLIKLHTPTHLLLVNRNSRVHVCLYSVLIYSFNFFSSLHLLQTHIRNRIIHFLPPNTTNIYC